MSRPSLSNPIPPGVGASSSSGSGSGTQNLQHLPQPSYRRAPPIQVQNHQHQSTRYTDRDLAMSPSEMDPPVQVFAAPQRASTESRSNSHTASASGSGSGTPVGGGYHHGGSGAAAPEAYRQNSNGSQQQQQQQLPVRSSSRSVSQLQQQAQRAPTSGTAFIESDPNGVGAPTPAQQIVHSVQQQQQQAQQQQQQQQVPRQRQTSAQYPSYDSRSTERERDLPIAPVAMSSNDPYYAQAQARLAEQGGMGMGIPGGQMNGNGRVESQYNMHSLASKRSMSTLPFVGEMGDDRMRRDSALPAPLLDQSHLRPGKSASLLTHDRTLELYRENAKKTNDPELIFEFSVFMIDAAKSMVPSDSASSDPDLQNPGAGVGRSLNALIDKRDELYKEATTLLKKLADKGYPDAQYYLADCYANGIGTVRGRQDFDRAFPLFVLAAKHGHPDACYRAGTCCEHGWGCRKENAKAVQFYKKAAVGLHPGAMYRLGLAELNGNLGLSRSPREGVKWLKRSAEHATEEFPHALHELALLHEQGIDNVVFVDNEYAAELLAQASELGYAPSAFKLGECYEYGKMDCPVDPALSIHYYNIAATQDHPDACFALTAWYLVGSPGVLPQSDTEAYLWAKKAAESGLAKAQYAVGYFTETGIGSEADMAAAMTWYKLAAESGDKRAQKRLQSGNKSAALDRRLEMEALKEERGAKGGKGGDKEGCVVM